MTRYQNSYASNAFNNTRLGGNNYEGFSMSVEDMNSQFSEIIGKKITKPECAPERNKISNKMNVYWLLIVWRICISILQEIIMKLDIKTKLSGYQFQIQGLHFISKMWIALALGA